jgi:Tfp pilus assembly protein PilV
LSERIVQVENEKTAVQAEFQRQQALQQQALQQLHMDKSKTEAVNEKLKNIIYDLQITIEDNSSDLSLLRVGEEKAKEEIDRLLEKCGKDRVAMTVIVEENTELKTRISALQKSKKSMKGILKKEISSVNVTAETYSNLKAILNRKLHLEEESMLLSADRDAGTDRDRERVTAEYASDGYGGGDVQLKIAVSIPDCGPGSSPDAALRRQSNLAVREYKRALGVLCCLSATFLFSCVLTALLSAAHPSQQVIYVTSVSISSLHPIDPLKSP